MDVRCSDGDAGNAEACRDQAQGGADALANVPFGGAGPAMVSVVGGAYADWLWLSGDRIAAHQGREIAGARRNEQDTLGHSPGGADHWSSGHFGRQLGGVLVPNGTPKDVVTRLNR
jgi:hypothetical protein